VSLSPAPAAAADGAITQYPFDATFSPIDERVARKLREIAARDTSRRIAFAKVGDSMTASGDFLHCFGRKKLELGAHAGLARTIERVGLDSFVRESQSAKIGWSAWQAVSSSPSPLELELERTKARFALVMFGTNDLEIGNLHTYAERLRDIVELATDRGVIPILFTIPARRDRADRDVWVPRYNAVIRALAQAEQIPLVDYRRELEKLPGKGLAKDGIHPSTFHGPEGRNACALDADGLRHGYNLRNLLALQTLERALAALDGRASDPPGTARRPDSERISSLPFVGSTRFVGAGSASAAAPAVACGAARPARGRERSYLLEIRERSAVRIMGFDRGGEVDMKLLGGDESAECIAGGERLIEAQLAPGTYRLVLGPVRIDAKHGDTLLAVLPEQ
jgi:hypothetical protein